MDKLILHTHRGSFVKRFGHIPGADACGDVKYLVIAIIHSKQSGSETGKNTNQHGHGWEVGGQRVSCSVLMSRSAEAGVADFWNEVR